MSVGPKINTTFNSSLLVQCQHIFIGAHFLPHICHLSEVPKNLQSSCFGTSNWFMLISQNRKKKEKPRGDGDATTSGTLWPILVDPYFLEFFFILSYSRTSLALSGRKEGAHRSLHSFSFWPSLPHFLGIYGIHPMTQLHLVACMWHGYQYVTSIQWFWRLQGQKDLNKPHPASTIFANMRKVIFGNPIDSYSILGNERSTKFLEMHLETYTTRQW